MYRYYIVQLYVLMTTAVVIWQRSRFIPKVPVPGYLSHGVESEAGPRGRRCPQGCRSREAAPSAMPHPGGTGPGAVTEPVGFFEDEDWSSSKDR